MSSFLCLLPTGAALEVLRAHPRPAVEHIRWEPEHRWHVTLRYSAHSDPRTVALLIDVADEVASECQPVEVTLGPKTERLGRDGTLVVPAHGVDALNAAVEESIGGALGEPGHPFVGHLTLARLRGTGGVPVELVGARIEAAFLATEIVLIESTPGGDGSKYSVLHRATVVG